MSARTFLAMAILWATSGLKGYTVLAKIVWHRDWAEHDYYAAFFLPPSSSLRGRVIGWLVRQPRNVMGPSWRSLLFFKVLSPASRGLRWVLLRTAYGCTWASSKVNVSLSYSQAGTKILFNDSNSWSLHSASQATALLTHMVDHLAFPPGDGLGEDIHGELSQQSYDFLRSMCLMEHSSKAWLRVLDEVLAAKGYIVR
jgi:hypothetical protein